MKKRIAILFSVLLAVLIITPCVLAQSPQTGTIVSPVFIEGSKQSGYSLSNTLSDNTIAVFVNGNAEDICVLKADYGTADILVNNVAVTFKGTAAGEFLLSGKSSAKIYDADKTTLIKTLVSEDEQNVFVGNPKNADEIMEFYYPADLSGDINGDKAVTKEDADLLAAYLVGKKNLTAEQLSLSDVNGDGKTDVSDCVAIMLKTK